MEYRCRGRVAHRYASPAQLLLPLRQPCRECCAHAKGNKRKPLGSQTSSNKSWDLVSTTTDRVSSPERGPHCKRKEVRRPQHEELRPPLTHPHILRLAARSSR